MKPAKRGETIAVASDHGGVELKAHLARKLAADGYDVLDLGTDGNGSVDYPVYADAMVAALNGGQAERGVLVCGTGIGISIAANRHPGVRAAVCHDEKTAVLARQHNDANILALGGRVLNRRTAEICLQAFLNTDFEDGGRHERRVAMMG